MRQARALFAAFLLAVGISRSAWALTEIRAEEMPPEARETLARIRAGGPFPYRRDGVVFHNYEQRLPARREGYYREYTVPTPGEKTRGPRRIVCGGDEPRRPAECYYTLDHYRSFRKIVE